MSWCGSVGYPCLAVCAVSLKLKLFGCKALGFGGFGFSVSNVGCAFIELRLAKFLLTFSSMFLAGFSI